MSSQAPSIPIDDDAESSVLSTLDSDLISQATTNVLGGEEILTANPTIAPILKRKRKRTALNTWQYARPPKSGEPERKPDGKKQRIWYCGLHGCQDPVFKCESTTSARYHLEMVHHIIVDVDDSQVKKARTQTLESVFATAAQKKQEKLEGNEHRVLRSVINLNAFKEALVRLIALRDLPFTCVEWPEFQALLMTVNYAVEEVFHGLQSHSVVPQIIYNSFIVHKDFLKRKLRTSLSLIHFTVDMWTSPNRKAFLAICAHWVDHDTKKLCKALLALPQIRGKHGGEEQAPYIMRVAKEYEIVEKIGYFTGDNHGSNDKLLRHVSKDLYKNCGIKWDPVHHRIRCHGHTTNLAVQAFLFAKDEEAIDVAIAEAEKDEDANMDDSLAEKIKNLKAAGYREMGALGRLHNIAVHIRSSEAHYNEFIDLAGESLGLDNDTRWNSWFELINKTKKPKVRSAIREYQERHCHDLEKDFFLLEHWKTLDDTHLFLQPFWKVIMETQGDAATLDQTLFTDDILIRHFEKSKAKHANNPRLLSSIITGWYAFDKWFKKTEDSPAYAAALLLHPSRRKAYVHKFWRKQWHKGAVDEPYKLWERSYEKLEVQPVQQEDSTVIKEPDEYDLLARELDLTMSGCSSFTKDSFHDFINCNPTPLPPNTTALEWWLREEQRRDYPRLSQMAIDILSIPAMSAEPERIFSGSRRTITWTRASLSGDRIEMLECLKSWIRENISSGLGFAVTQESQVDGKIKS